MTITLPKPPSTNHIYGFTSRGGFARSYITKEGKEWFATAEEIIKKKNRRKTPIDTEIEVWVTLYTAYYTKQDADGILKPTLDVLQKSGVIKNDALIYKIDVEKYSCKKEEQRVEIEIQGY